MFLVLENIRMYHNLEFISQSIILNKNKYKIKHLYDRGQINIKFN